jgi:hypothetical protein
MNIAHEKIREELVVDTAAGGELPISQVDYYVKQQYPSASVSQVQNETLATIRSLADDGLIVLGAMSGEGGRWEAWDGLAGPQELVHFLARVDYWCVHWQPTELMAGLPQAPGDDHGATLPCRGLEGIQSRSSVGGYR